MMKKARRVPVNPSPPGSSRSIGEAKERFKHQSLLCDYEELLQETETKRRKLRQTDQRKLRLLAEVRFLQRKYKSLSANPSRQIHSRVKKQSHGSPAPTLLASASSLPCSIVESDRPLPSTNCRASEVVSPSTTAALDLNQISLPNEEVACDLWESPKTCKSSRCSVGGSAANDGNLSSFVTGNSSNGARKRKIAWRDQMVLKV